MSHDLIAHHPANFPCHPALCDRQQCHDDDSPFVETSTVNVQASTVNDSSVNNDSVLTTVDSESSAHNYQLMSGESPVIDSSMNESPVVTDSPPTVGDPPHVYNNCISYEHANQYWSSVPDTLNGMLGGLGHVSHIDLQASARFLAKLGQVAGAVTRERALDCGAGIGRVTRYLLSRHFARVDLVEQCAKFADTARTYLETVQQLGEIHCSGLQDFDVPVDTYDLIWCQWVLGHLTDHDLVQFLRRCSKGLRANGVIVIKENIRSIHAPPQYQTIPGVRASSLSAPSLSSSEPPPDHASTAINVGQCSSTNNNTPYHTDTADEAVSRNVPVDFDTSDSSITRPLSLWLSLFDKAGLESVSSQIQRGFPRQLYQVRMFALRPAGFPLGAASVVSTV